MTVKVIWGSFDAFAIFSKMAGSKSTIDKPVCVGGKYLHMIILTIKMFTVIVRSLVNLPFQTEILDFGNTYGLHRSILDLIVFHVTLGSFTPVISQ